MSIPSQVLLAVSVFLFLTPGDALLCIHCIVAIPGVPCRHSLCEIDDEGVCVGFISYKRGEFIDKILGCGKKEKVRCDISRYQEKGINTEHKCCDDSDFCNASF